MPKPGDFAVVKIRGGAGLAIRIGQWLVGGGFKDYEHVLIYVGDGNIVEAEPGGARMALLSSYANQSLLWSTVPLTDEQRVAICRAAVGYVGTPYSYLDYLSLFLVRFLHIRFKGLQRYIANTGHMICSVLVDQCYQDGKQELFDDHRWVGDVIPSDMYWLIVAK